MAQAREYQPLLAAVVLGAALILGVAIGAQAVEDVKASRIRAARMGVLQITPAFSVEVSDYGINDTSSLDKDITAVVSMEFEIR